MYQSTVFLQKCTENVAGRRGEVRDVPKSICIREFPIPSYWQYFLNIASHRHKKGLDIGTVTSESIY